MILWPTKKVLAAAMADALSQFYTAKLGAAGNSSESVASLRADLNTLVRHGVRLEKIAGELSVYAHANVHKLRNVATVMLLLLEESGMPAERKKELVAELQEMLKPEVKVAP